MGAAGPIFYDDETVFVTYQQGRQRTDNPNDTLEKPVILELIGDIAGKSVLDLGCGDAAIGREFLQGGATAYLGLDGSAKMVTLASQTLAGTAGRVIQHSIEDWHYPPATFDLVLARLVLHYIADFPTLCAKVWQTLRPGGKFVFSVEHPVITSTDRGWVKGGARQDWLVDHYFDTGLMENLRTDWIEYGTRDQRSLSSGHFAGSQATVWCYERAHATARIGGEFCLCLRARGSGDDLAHQPQPTPQRRADSSRSRLDQLFGGGRRFCG